MNYEIKRWKLVGALCLAIAGIVFTFSASIAILILFLFIVQVPSLTLIISGFMTTIVVMTVLILYAIWQRIIEVRNSAWRLSLDEEGISLETLRGHKRLIWQQLTKIEKQLAAQQSLIYKLESIDGDKTYILGEMVGKTDLFEQIKTLANKVGATITFVLPERPSMPLYSKMIASTLIIFVAMYMAYSVWVILQMLAHLEPSPNDCLYGYINKTGKLIIPANFDEAEDFCSYGALVKVDGKWGCIDKSGQFIVEPKFKDRFDFDLGDGKSGLVRIIISDKAGFTDCQGKQIIKSIYDSASGFYDGVADVKLNKKWGRIDKTGKFIIKPIFDEEIYSTFDKGKGFAVYKGQVVSIDRTGKILFKTPFSYLRGFSEGISEIELHNKLGYMDENGKAICEPKYDAGTDFQDGLAAVNLGEKVNVNKNDSNLSIENGKWGYIDRSGQLIIPIQFEHANDFSEGLASVLPSGSRLWFQPFKFNNWGYIDHSGNYVVKPSLDVAMSFKDGLAVVADDNNKWGYINKTGSYAIKPSFQYAENFSEGLASVRANNKYGYINKTGDFIIPPIFDAAEQFSEGLAKVGFVKVKAK